MNVPYSIIPFRALKNISKIFFGIGKRLESVFPSLTVYLEHMGIRVSAAHYISMCIFSSLVNFVILLVILILFLLKFNVKSFLLLSFLISLVIALFVFFQQVLYPKIKANKKIKDIDKNLLPALQNMLVQLNSGVPLFNILVSIGSEDYGEISKFNVTGATEPKGKKLKIVAEIGLEQTTTIT